MSPEVFQAIIGLLETSVVTLSICGVAVFLIYKLFLAISEAVKMREIQEACGRAPLEHWSAHDWRQLLVMLEEHYQTKPKRRRFADQTEGGDAK